jgi:Rhs element Vgr protein
MFGRKTIATGLETRFYFESLNPNLDNETFKVVSFEGEEEISRPYRFEIELASESPEIDAAELIRWPAWLGIKRDGELRKIHGVIIEFQQKQEGPYGLYFYRAVLVPRLWLLSLSRQNQIYRNNSVPRIIEKELKGANKKHGSNLGTALTADDYELRLKLKCPDPVMTIVGDVSYFDPGEYPTREYTVQYNESDLDFISRLMEHAGIFYFFEHDEEKEKLIIADDNDQFLAIAEESDILYNPPSAMVPEEESIQAFSCRHRCIPNKVVLKDYNYRKPHLPQQAEADVLPEGCGLISEYGNHFKVPEEGALLAEIRAQEFRCRQKVFVGEGDCSQFRAGYRYTLDEHYRQDFNREYVITRVRHSGHQPLSGVTELEQGEKEETSYRNEFTAIPSDVMFRPERRTPKPKLHGIMNAHVDTAILEDRAEIDEQGRYKVVMPFDQSGTGRGKASRFIRMAQPYGGRNHGMHFPLHKGTEVIWTCIDGDPDRPIIVGAVPNPLHPSMVTADNSTKNVIQTASGVRMEFCDGPGSGSDTPQSPSPHSSGELMQQRQYQGIEDSIVKISESVSGSAKGNCARKRTLMQNKSCSQESRPAGLRNLAEQQQMQTAFDTIEESEQTGTNDKWFRIKVPEYATGKDSYLRLGDAPTDEYRIIDTEEAYDQSSTLVVQTISCPATANCEITPSQSGAYTYTDPKGDLPQDLNFALATGTFSGTIAKSEEGKDFDFEFKAHPPPFRDKYNQTSTEVQTFTCPEGVTSEIDPSQPGTYTYTEPTSTLPSGLALDQNFASNGTFSGTIASGEAGKEFHIEFEAYPTTSSVSYDQTTSTEQFLECVAGSTIDIFPSQTGTYTYTSPSSKLPSGLTFDPITGIFTGTVAQSEAEKKFAIDFEATPGGGSTVAIKIKLIVKSNDVNIKLKVRSENVKIRFSVLPEHKHEKPGWFDYTDGDHTSITMVTRKDETGNPDDADTTGKDAKNLLGGAVPTTVQVPGPNWQFNPKCMKETIVHGGHKKLIEGDVTKTITGTCIKEIYGNHKTEAHGNKEEYWNWDNTKHTGGHTFETYVGSKEKICLGNEFGINIINLLKLYIGLKEDIALGKTIKFNLLEEKKYSPKDVKKFYGRFKKLFQKKESAGLKKKETIGDVETKAVNYKLTTGTYKHKTGSFNLKAAGDFQVEAPLINILSAGIIKIG